jgi:catechol 2,3-dioxygenase-like lactoylglutathione lyase family enzyme
MRIERIQHASIPRPRGEAALAQATHFYRDVLGCEELPKPSTFDDIDVAWFACGEDEIHVLAIDQKFPLDHGGAHFCLVCDDLYAVRERLEGAGFACADTTPIPNRPRFVTFDPFGNAIEITALQGDYRSASSPRQSS